MATSTRNDLPTPRKRGGAALPLRLRVRGTSRHGQIVVINGPRCTIGSSASCTLRLTAEGVRPIHCLIVRGLGGPTVRSLAQDTLLNGQSFREQALEAGDRLQIGVVEFEVLGDGITQAAATRTRQPLPPASQQPPPPAAALPAELADWTHAHTTRPLEVLEQQLAVESLRSEKEDLTAELARVRAAQAETELRQQQFVREHATLVEEYADLSQQVAVLNQENAAQEQQILALTSERDDLRQQLVERVRDNSELVRESELLFRENTELRSLQSGQSQLTQELRELTQYRDQAEQRYGQLQQQFAQLELRFHETEQRVAAVDQERQNLAAECSRLQDCITETAEKRLELEQELHAAREQFARLEAEYRSAIERPSCLIPDDTAAPSQPLVPQVPQVPQEPISESAPDSPSMFASHQRESRYELQWLAQQWAKDDQLDIRHRDAEPSAVEQPPVEQAPLEQAPLEQAPLEQAPLEQAPLEDDGKERTAALQRLLEAGIWRDKLAGDDEPAGVLADECFEPSLAEATDADDGAAAATDTPPRESESGYSDSYATESGLASAYVPDWNAQACAGEPIVGPNEEEVHPAEEEASRSVPPSGEGGAEDDSIESYMRRLLERVRGSGGEATITSPVAKEQLETTPAADERQPITEIRMPVPSPIPEANESESTTDEYLPRSHAPEITASLAAMRELANANRRSNLLNHAQQKSTVRSDAKLLGSLSASALAIASAFYLNSHPRLASFTLFSSLTAAVWWTLQGISARRRSQATRSLISRRHPGNVAASQAEDESPSPTEEKPPD